MARIFIIHNTNLKKLNIMEVQDQAFHPHQLEWEVQEIGNLKKSN
jgi:hypothetical protein